MFTLPASTGETTRTAKRNTTTAANKLTAVIEMN